MDCREEIEGLSLRLPVVPELSFWKIDECAVYYDRLHVRGWCHVPGADITRVELQFAEDVVLPVRSFGHSSPDVDAACGPGAGHVRFDECLPIPDGFAGKPFVLRCTLADGQIYFGRDALTNAAWGDAYFNSWENFLAALAKFDSGAVLEIGSRARSGITRRHRVPRHLEYVGVDIVAGPNVDLVADAHELSRALEGRKFIAAFSTSVFEHLAMPWKVALELNRVLEPGGIVYTASHQTFPVHDEPWDFWRYSPHTWSCLFNAETGFEVVETAVGERARIYPCRTSDVTRDLHLSPAWLGSACLARKVAETSLTWPVSTSSVTKSAYPAGSLTCPATSDPT